MRIMRGTRAVWGRHTALLWGVSGLVLGAAQAQAQTAPASPPLAPAQPQSDTAGAPDSFAGDIVITAQKRTEKLQNVPISVTVISAKTFEAFNVNEATDLQYFVPGVQVLNSAGPRSFGFYIRGVGTTSFSSESVEGSVAFVVDGVVMGQSGASLADLPDIERVEVLKGPQATLFGKNASAGVINVVTRRPSDHWEGKVDVSWAWPLNERKLSGLITGPISDTVRILLSGRVNKRDGNVTNLYDGRDLNDRNDYGFRGKLEFTPDSRLTSTLIADWWQRRAACCIWTLRRVGPTPNALELSQIAAGIVPSPTNEQQNVDGDVRSNVDSWGISLDNEYELGGDYTISSITAFRSWHSIDGLDTDSQPTNIYNVNYADFKQRQVSQELRLTSPKSGLIDYVLGAFYFHQKVKSISYQNNLSSVAAYAGKAVTNDATTDNYAIFGQANINLSNQFRLIVGGRWVSETAFASKYRLDTRSLATQFSQAEKTNSALLWRFGAQYDLSKDANVFATITRGFKGGGYDTGIGFPDLFDVKPERPTNTELGIRTSWPDAGLTFNVTAFHTIVDDYQISARAPGALSIYYLINAAKLRSNGIEFDFSWRPVRSADFVISGGGMYDEAIFKSFPNAQCWAGQTAAQGCVGGQQNLTGSELPHAPKWSGNLMASYTGDLGSSGWKYHIDADVNYHSRAGQGFPISPWMYQDGYALMNMSIGISGKNDLWRVSVFGRNLTDKDFATNIGSTVLGSSPGSTQQYPLYEARRVIGVSLGLKF
jgi:iron complex outermembrane receptor protein